MYRLSSLIFIALFLSSCQSDIGNEETLIDNLDIPNELSAHFETFQNEASTYGIQIDYEGSNVTAEISQINEGSVAGTCTTNGHNIRHIEIDQNFWNRASHLQREMVIFHELGHCILQRGHKEDGFQNGICKSIMRSGLGTCTDAYTPANRDYFIEELFTEVD